MRLPWQENGLDRWSIVGMNHYNMRGTRFLFVSMTKGDRCIQIEGPLSPVEMIEFFGDRSVIPTNVPTARKEKEHRMNQCPPLPKAEEIQARLQKQFDAWFVKLQALTSHPLSAEDWTQRWFDGYTPEEALGDGPE